MAHSRDFTVLKSWCTIVRKARMNLMIRAIRMTLIKRVMRMIRRIRNYEELPQKKRNLSTYIFKPSSIVNNKV
eukprot:CAMPEP_0115198410 /NCGR_PEP_ID=MMETSP0270-20121206/16091_1 /TAXON_ID=71861 /ORGANISM="Scrippsiella trochoidea, Strain CCMP3099" /LENGTH=72 /DNA_ID=CAMNT_0002611781 /DNA_START=515 /DNA_END=733 /DNA_ORIENTATION=+